MLHESSDSRRPKAALDVYAELFADNLDEVADRLDHAFANMNADQVRTTAARSAVTPLVERRRNAAG